MSKRRIELFGRLKDAGLGSAVLIYLPHRATVRQAMKAVETSFGSKHAVLKGCALASDDAVLSLSDRLPSKGRLALLPPVCGG